MFLIKIEIKDKDGKYRDIERYVYAATIEKAKEKMIRKYVNEDDLSYHFVSIKNFNVKGY